MIQPKATMQICIVAFFRGMVQLKLPYLESESETMFSGYRIAIVADGYTHETTSFMQVSLSLVKVQAIIDLANFNAINGTVGKFSVHVNEVHYAGHSLPLTRQLCGEVWSY